MEILSNISLKPYNSFGLDVLARYFVRVQGEEEIKEALEWARKKELPTLVLGGGSNILFTGNYPGLVIKNECRGIELLKSDPDFFYVTAQAGEPWHPFVRYCLEKGYAGVENLALIPGCVGASPMQNIGAYGVEIKEVFYELRAIHRFDGGVQVFNKADCAFGYRESVFKNKYKDQFIISEVTYKLRKQPEFHIGYGAIQQELGDGDISIQSIAQAVMKIRSSKLPDPAKLGNAGSFFKNPTVDRHQYQSLKAAYPNLVAYENLDGTMKLAAGWLIEAVGLKGYRQGDAGIHEKQALVLVNYGQATGEEILALCELVMKTVADKMGIALAPEVNII